MSTNNDGTKWNQDTNDEVEIDLLEIWQVIKKNFFSLFFLLFIFATGAGLITKFILTPTYSSSSTIFLTPYIDESGYIDYTSQNSNERLIYNVMALLVQDNVLAEVTKQVGVDSIKTVRDSLEITNESDTTLIKVEATTEDPKLSKKIVNATVQVFIDTMQENLNLKNIEIVNPAKLSYVPSGPNLKKNILIGAAMGFVLDGLIVLIKVLTNNRLKSKEEAEKYLNLPVYCELPVIKE
ncbi:YveK family protein [Floccifex sp.]|uniref:YveK family protein n=1 Tax=Floccifex sp. TaxID=2815810 RepID=UPI003F073BCF